MKNGVLNLNFSLLQIDHVLLAAPRGSENLARTFYADVLGLKEIEKPPMLKKRGGVWFELGN